MKTSRFNIHQGVLTTYDITAPDQVTELVRASDLSQAELEHYALLGLKLSLTLEAANTYPRNTAGAAEYAQALAAVRERFSRSLGKKSPAVWTARPDTHE